MFCVFLPGSRRIHAKLYRQRYRFIPPQPPFLDAAGSTSRGRVSGGSTPVILERPVGLGPMSTQTVSRALHIPLGPSGPSKVRSAAKKAFEAALSHLRLQARDYRDSSAV
jgi:hypothetical protein